jgi:hypothetical protein
MKGSQVEQTPRLSAGQTDAAPVTRAREILGSDAIGMTDDAVTQVAAHANTLARLIVEAYLASDRSGRAA